MSSTALRTKQLLIAIAVAVLAALLTATPASAQNEGDDVWPEGVGVLKSLTSPTTTSGPWQFVPSGDRFDGGWLSNFSGDGSATYDFGGVTNGYGAIICWVPAGFQAQSFDYRIQHDRIDRVETVDLSYKGAEGAWVTLNLGGVTEQYDLVLTATTNTGAAVADECHFVLYYGSRSPAPPWHPTATDIDITEDGVTFNWDPANGGITPTSHRVSVSLPGIDWKPMVCKAWWSGSPWYQDPANAAELWQRSCTVTWSELATLAEQTGVDPEVFADELQYEVQALRETQRYGSDSYPDLYEPTSLTIEEDEEVIVTPPLDRPANPRNVAASEITDQSAVISWDHVASSNSVTYRVWLSGVGEGGPFCESHAPFGGRESCRLFDLDDGRTYEANVFAMNANGVPSLRTERITFTTLNTVESSLHPSCEDGSALKKRNNKVRKANVKAARKAKIVRARDDIGPKKKTRIIRRLLVKRDKAITEARNDYLELCP